MCIGIKRETKNVTNHTSRWGDGIPDGDATALAADAASRGGVPATAAASRGGGAVCWAAALYATA